MSIEDCIRSVNKMSSEIRLFQAENRSGLSAEQSEKISSYLADVFMMRESLVSIKMVSDFNLSNGISPVYCSGDSLSSDLFDLYEQLVSDGKVLMSDLLNQNV